MLVIHNIELTGGVGSVISVSPEREVFSGCSFRRVTIVADDRVKSAEPVFSSCMFIDCDLTRVSSALMSRCHITGGEAQPACSGNYVSPDCTIRIGSGPAMPVPGEGQ